MMVLHPGDICLTSNTFFSIFVKIAEFRKGNYEDKDDNVKEAWLFCMMELMCYVNTAWARVGIKRTKKLWMKTTPSDEALVCWYLTCYVDEWTKEVEDENEHYSGAKEAKLPRRFKRRTEHYSRTKLFRFVQLEREIKSLRGASRGWDDAITEEADRLYGKKAPKSKSHRGREGATEAFDLPELKMSEYRLEFITAEI